MIMNKKILVTGGAGFIGSALIRHLIKKTQATVINVDKLTYAGNLESLLEISDDDRYVFEHLDIVNFKELQNIFIKHEPDLVMHLAAESHVDRSIDGPAEFINTNIIGTFNLLEASRYYLQNQCNSLAREKFRFHHISTDEVYGDLLDDTFFTENTPYDPSSPYSASKASSDHLVRAWHRTYKLPTLITNCSNNYGPFHYPEKLIPLIILNALKNKPLPIYGNGNQIRDWLYVDDHVGALCTVAESGKIGETYNIGGFNEKKNIDVVLTICNILEELVPDNPIAKHSGGEGYQSLISYVKDRPGHDLRYAIDATKINNELGWSPSETFESGIQKTVEWYIQNRDWTDSVLNK